MTTLSAAVDGIVAPSASCRFGIRYIPRIRGCNQPERGTFVGCYAHTQASEVVFGVGKELLGLCRVVGYEDSIVRESQGGDRM